jgi:hypothetical protein
MFQVQNVSVLEFPHVKLAHGRSTLRPVGNAVDHESTRAADSFAAVVVEGHRLFALRRQLFVQNVEHFQERHVLRCRH